MKKNIKWCITDDLSNIETKYLVNELPSFFGNSGDFSKNAILNWRFDNITDIETQFVNMGSGYLETAIMLLEKCIDDNRNKKADVWISPILHNTVHGIELYLKAFNSLYNTYLGLSDNNEIKEGKIIGRHDLKQLCQKYISLVKKTSGKNLRDGLLVDFLFVEKFIKILYAKTSGMTFARYPVNSKKEKHFYAETSENVEINLYALLQWILRIFMIFDSITTCIDVQIDEMKDYLYQTQIEGYP